MLPLQRYVKGRFRNAPAGGRHLATLGRIALLVGIGDYATKEAAAQWIGQSPASLGWIHFAVVHNQRAAFGFSLGEYTWQLNLALTLAAIVLVIPVARDLARIDPAAPRALGLIVGGALGNLASLILSPRGVIDFIALRLDGASELVLNVADVAAYAGLAMVLRTGFLIVAAMQREARPRIRTPRQRSVPTVVSLVMRDREVSRTVYHEPVLTMGEGEVFADGPTSSIRPTARVLPFPSALADAPQAPHATESLALQLPPAGPAAESH